MVLLVTLPKKPVILVVEDDPDFMTIMRLLLESRNFEVATANGGVQALHWLEDHTPDAIILDIMMPDLNGFAVLRKVRADEHLGMLPVIMLSPAPTRRLVMRVWKLELTPTFPSQPRWGN